MNIVQAFTKYNKGSVILISGLSGSGKCKLASFLANLMDHKLIKLEEYYKPNVVYDKDENYVELKNNVRVLNWDNIYESVNWDSLNDFIDQNKQNGIVICGMGFPKDNINHKDFHIHIKINKQNLIEKRTKYLESHPEQNKMNEETQKLLLNDVTFPLYLKVRDDSQIDKFINANELSEDDIKDESFKYLMNVIESWLNTHDNTQRNSNRQFVKQYNRYDNKQDNRQYNTYKRRFMNRTFGHLDIGDIEIDDKLDDKPNDKPNDKPDEKTEEKKPESEIEPKKEIKIEGKTNNDVKVITTKGPKIDDLKMRSHYEGNKSAYDDYFHNKKIKIYDFNDEGDAYPEEYRALHQESSSSVEDSDKVTSSTDSNNSDDQYLYTIPGDVDINTL